MRRASAGCALVVVLAACGLDLEGTATPDAGATDAPGDVGARFDATAPDDAGAADAPVTTNDAGADGQGPPADAGKDAPAPLVYTCGTTKVTDCATCSGSPLPCVVCGDGGAHDAYCIPNDGATRCLDRLPAGFAICPCTYPDASTCPMEYQVCHDNSPIGIDCRTCGEPSTVVDRDTCKKGGTCQGLLMCQ